MAYLEVRGLEKAFVTARGTTRVLAGLDAAVAAGLRTLCDDGIGARGLGRASFGERRRAGEPGYAASLDLGDELLWKQPHD